MSQSIIQCWYSIELNAKVNILDEKSQFTGVVVNGKIKRCLPLTIVKLMDQIDYYVVRKTWISIGWLFSLVKYHLISVW